MWLALGANAREVVGLVLREGSAWMALGLTAGAVAALLAIVGLAAAAIPRHPRRPRGSDACAPI